jgi:hypothetical protein
LTSVTYQIEKSRDYLRKARANILNGDPRYKLLGFMLDRRVIWASGILLVGVAFFIESAGPFNWGVIVFFTVALLSTVVATYRNEQVLRSAARRKDILSARLDEDGLKVDSPGIESKFGWPACIRAVTYADGLLLIFEARAFWLPDDALTYGTPQEARALVPKSVLSSAP